MEPAVASNACWSTESLPRARSAQRMTHLEIPPPEAFNRSDVPAATDAISRTRHRKSDIESFSSECILHPFRCHGHLKQPNADGVVDRIGHHGTHNDDGGLA